MKSLGGVKAGNGVDATIVAPMTKKTEIYRSQRERNGRETAGTVISLVGAGRRGTEKE